MQIIAAQKPDPDGNVIPLNAREGSLVFASADGITAPLNLSVNLGVFNVTAATCWYGCIPCDGYESIYISPGSLDLPYSGIYSLSLYGVYSDGEDYGVSGDWSSSNTSVLSISDDGDVDGEGRGSVTITATAILPANGQVCGYNPECDGGNDTNFSATSGVNVGPHHLKVVSDTNGILCGTTGPVRRQITYQVEYVDNTDYDVTTSVQESFSSVTTNTCGNGQPTPSGCNAAGSGRFTDTLDVTSGCFYTGSSCGFSLNQQWLSCSTNDGSIGTNTGVVVHANAITVHSVTTPSQIPAGTMINP